MSQANIRTNASWYFKQWGT